MKIRLHLAVLVTLPALLGATTAQAQDAHRSPPRPPTHNEEVSIELQATKEAGAQSQVEERQIKQLRHITDAQQGHALAANTRLHAMLGQPGPTHASGQALIIRTRDLDPESQSQLEEDLHVMSRIVEKAAQSEPTRGPRAMGIDLVFGPGESPVRTLYLDGYGVLFMVKVGFPLLPLPVQAPEEAEDPQIDVTNTWEQTRQELYGDPRPPEPMLPMGWFGDPSAETLTYDAGKVDRLRQNLIEAIRNASNIRQLTADASVTICVQGALATPLLQVRRESTIDKPDGTGRNVEVRKRIETVLTTGRKTDANRAILTLQATKADIDRFARGELSPDQFRELTRSQVYLGTGWNFLGTPTWSAR